MSLFDSCCFPSSAYELPCFRVRVSLDKVLHFWSSHPLPGSPKLLADEHHHTSITIAVMPIPQLPGRLVPRHSDEEIGLKTLVGRMCHLESDRSSMLPYWSWQAAQAQWISFRFPGSQPVSFGAKDLAKLENQEWVTQLRTLLRVTTSVVFIATGSAKSPMGFGFFS